MVRLLPEGRPKLCTSEPPERSVRFGFSQPCVRCLRALQAFGVHRVIFSTGEPGDGGEVGCMVREVTSLLADVTASGGHCSRGDHCAVAVGAVRRQECE